MGYLSTLVRIWVFRVHNLAMGPYLSAFGPDREQRDVYGSQLVFLLVLQSTTSNSTEYKSLVIVLYYRFESGPSSLTRKSHSVFISKV